MKLLKKISLFFLAIILLIFIIAYKACQDTCDDSGLVIYSLQLEDSIIELGNPIKFKIKHNIDAKFQPAPSFYSKVQLNKKLNEVHDPHFWEHSFERMIYRTERNVLCIDSVNISNNELFLYHSIDSTYNDEVIEICLKFPDKRYYSGCQHSGRDDEYYVDIVLNIKRFDNFILINGYKYKNYKLNGGY